MEFFKVFDPSNSRSEILFRVSSSGNHLTMETENFSEYQEMTEDNFRLLLKVQA